MTRQLLITLGVMSLELGYQGIGLALECPTYPEQSNKEWEVKAEAAVAKLGRLSGPDVKLTIRNATQDLLGKVPNADTVYLEKMFYTGICTGLRDDPSLTEGQKTQKLTEYIAVVHKYLKPPPLIASQPSGIISSKQQDKQKRDTPHPPVSPPVTPPTQAQMKPPEAQCDQSTVGLTRKKEVVVQNWRSALNTLPSTPNVSA